MVDVTGCMEARLYPAKCAWLSEGDAHVIRNAGGPATDDAIRSLVISCKLLGTKEWFVIHHIDYSMQLFDDEIIGGLLEQIHGYVYDVRSGRLVEVE